MVTLRLLHLCNFFKYIKAISCNLITLLSVSHDEGLFLFSSDLFSDLDSQVSSGGLDQILTPTPSQPNTQSFYKSVTVTKVVKPDGVSDLGTFFSQFAPPPLLWP